MDQDGMNQEEAQYRRQTEIDGSSLTSEALQELLSRSDEEIRRRLVRLPESLAAVGAGNACSIDLVIAGSVGPYAFMLSQKGKVEIAENAGLACGHSLHSGSILVRGDCGDYLAAYAVGGLVAVYGKARDFAAFGLSGGEVVVRSRCGNAAGAQMRSGALVLGNGAGDQLGHGMTGGTIFVRGSVAGLGEGVTAAPIKDSDSLRLSLMLARAGLKTKQSEFQAFRAKERGKSPFGPSQPTDPIIQSDPTRHLTSPPDHRPPGRPQL